VDGRRARAGPESNVDSGAAALSPTESTFVAAARHDSVHTSGHDAVHDDAASDDTFESAGPNGAGSRRIRGQPADGT